MKEKWFEFFERFIDEGHDDETASKMAQDALIDYISGIRDQLKECERG